jgi:hypothetical protein
MEGEQSRVWTRRYRPLALIMALMLSVPWAALVAPPVALADVVTATQVNGTGDQTKLPGATGTASFYLANDNSNPLDLNGCNAGGDKPATITVTSSDTNKVTINTQGTPPASSFTVTGCGPASANSIGYSVKSDATAGEVTITGTGSGGKGGVYSAGSFKVIITTPADTTPPTIRADGVPSGWTNVDPVKVTLNATDTVALKSISYKLDSATSYTESVISGPSASLSASLDVLVSGNGMHTLTYCTTDAANNSTCPPNTPASVQIKIDTLNPTVSGTVTTDPNGAGWYNGNVTVHWTCADQPFPTGTVGGTTPSGLVASGTGSCSSDSVITGEGSNLSAGPVTVKDNAGNTSALASVSGIKIDRGKPTISGQVVNDNGTPRSPTAGWYNSAVRVRFTCNDPVLADGTPGSGVTCPGDTVLSNDGANQNATTTVTDAAGNTSVAGGVTGINIDSKAPETSATIECTGRNGWCRNTATVKLAAVDQAGLSGVKEINYRVGSTGNFIAKQAATEDVTVPLNAQGRATVYFYAVDNAGNVESTGSADVLYDTIAPTIAITRNPTANAEGWNNATATNGVTVQFKAEDQDAGTTGSGVETLKVGEQAPLPIVGSNTTVGATAAVTYSTVVSTDTAGRTYNVAAEDFAGNIRADSVTVKLDRTLPTIGGAATTNPNANGWYTGPVMVQFTCADPGTVAAGIATCTGWSGSTNLGVPLNSNGANQSVPGTAVDKAGNQASTAVNGINIDAEKPNVKITVGTTTSAELGDGTVYNAGAFTLGAVPTLSCTAVDSVSGPKDCTVGAPVNSNANGVGTVTATATATDNAGNTTKVTISYQVSYRFDGFLQPINDTAHQTGLSTSVFKAGSTVPAKFQLKKSDGTVVQAATAPQWLTTRGSSTTAAVDESFYSDPVTTGSTYRWDSTAQQYIYNWGTAKNQAGFYWGIGVKLDDGKTHWANIGLR